MEALPVELIAKIFLIGCEDIRDPSYHPTLSRYRATISSVSPLWRNVALSTSLLWTDVVVTKSSDSDIHRALFFLRLDLERSSKALIDVHFGLPTDSNANQFGAPWLWIPIREQLHRCRSISIHGLSEQTMKTILPLPGPLPQLEKLSISNPLPHPFPSILTSSSVAPKLREVFLDEVDFHGLASIPTEYLTTIRLHAQCSPGSLVSAFLSQCSALTTLVAFFRFSAEEIRDPPAIVESPAT